MTRIAAQLLSRFSLRRCSMPGCSRRAAASLNPMQFLCELHMTLLAVGKTALAAEQERRTTAPPDFLEQVEQDATLRKIEAVGMENFDPQTNEPRDAGRLMHEKRKP